MNNKKFSLIVLALVGILAFTGYSCSKGGGGKSGGSGPDLTELGEKAEAVDLGLTVKWASCNIGANKPEEEGTYFCWGDSTGKGKMIDATDNTPKEISGTGMDIARVMYGGNWRMPTQIEIQEFVTQCKFSLVTQGGKKVIKAVGPTGNFILLPLSGESNGGTSKSYEGDDAEFMSGTYKPESRGIVTFSCDTTLFYHESSVGIIGDVRLVVRPVTK